MALSQTDLDQMFIDAAISGDNDEVEKALKRGADIHADDDMALGQAAGNGHKETVALLLERGADIHAKYDRALLWAVEYGCNETVALLLGRGADIHVGNDLALRLAARDGHKERVALLLDRGAYIHAENELALRRAAEHGHKETALLLLRYGADPKVTNRVGRGEFANAKLAGWLDQLKQETRDHFKSDKPSREQCLATDDKGAPRVQDAVLDACVSNQFGTLIGAPLLASTDKADRQLFQDIWDALPEHWQNQNPSIYVQFIKEG